MSDASHHLQALTGASTHGKLHLVDLAGSERVKKSEVMHATPKQGGEGWAREGFEWCGVME